MSEFVFLPIGFARTPFKERVHAPRQAPLAKDVEATIVLEPGHGFEDALDGLETFSHVWLLFAFDRNAGHFRPKVLPPRSKGKRIGLFATRSPHRPNPIGMSVVELVSVSGLEVRVRGCDLLDGTPIFDIKPYVAYADSIADASGGWVASDPEAPWAVTFAPLAEAQLEFIARSDASQNALREDIATRLALGPQPHAYRRIKVERGRARLALKEWRVFFSQQPSRAIVVDEIATGYRDKQLEPGGSAPELHRAFRQNVWHTEK